MNPNLLEKRSQAVLIEVIDKYIETAEPVGSRTIAKIHPEHLSSATLRNVMADLEDMGFLSQPHKSAGRIPTDKGYRFYVDHLLRPQSFLMKAEVLSESNPLEYPVKNKTFRAYWKKLAKTFPGTQNKPG